MYANITLPLAVTNTDVKETECTIFLHVISMGQKLNMFSSIFVKKLFQKNRKSEDSHKN